MWVSARTVNLERYFFSLTFYLYIYLFCRPMKTFSKISKQKLIHADIYLPPNNHLKAIDYSYYSISDIKHFLQIVI